VATIPLTTKLILRNAGRTDHDRMDGIARKRIAELFNSAILIADAMDACHTAGGTDHCSNATAACATPKACPKAFYEHAMCGPPAIPNSSTSQ